MTSGSVSGMVRRNAWRRVFYPVAEIIHLCTVYLGLAVLVACVLTLTITPLRLQAQQAHALLIAALKPGGARLTLDYAQSDPGLQGTTLSSPSPVLSADDLPWPIPADSEFQADESAPGASIPHLNFTRALADSHEQFRIPGVSATQAEALRSYIARKYRIAVNVAGALINTVFTVAREKDLDPQLLLAVIAIESRYNPFAESHMGAQGLMQVMTRVHTDKFAAFGEGPLAALHPLANIQVGAQILSDCINRRGSLDGGLACYVGATGPSDGGYGAKVKAERRRIALASGIPLKG